MVKSYDKNLLQALVEVNYSKLLELTIQKVLNNYLKQKSIIIPTVRKVGHLNIKTTRTQGF